MNADTTVYVWAIIVGIASLAIFARIPPNGCLDEPRLEAEEALVSARKARDGPSRRPPPLGAAVCDRLCFGETVMAALAQQEARAASGASPPRRHGRAAALLAEEEPLLLSSPRSPRSSDDTKDSIAEWHKRRAKLRETSRNFAK